MDAIQTITSYRVNGVNTVPPGSPANVSLSVIGNTLRVNFDLPQGEAGPTAKFPSTISQRHLRNQQQQQRREHAGHGSRWRLQPESDARPHQQSG